MALTRLTMTGWVGQRFQHGYAWSPRVLVYGNALRIPYQGLITCLSHMERHPTITETLITNTPHKERSPLLGDLDSLLTTI